MGEVIWVEILSRQHGVVARHRCTGSEIRIGRGYGNDIVLDDPFIAPAHLRIARDAEGALVAEDLGSVNGLFAGRSGRRLERVVIDGDQPIRIGHTALRIRPESHAVAPERRLEAGWRWGTLAVAAAAVGIIALEALSLWLNQTAEPRASYYLSPLLLLPALLLAWAAGWSIVSRIFSGHASFERNLAIALAGYLAYAVIAILCGFLAFALSWRPLGTYQYIAAWPIFAAVCVFHLLRISPAHARAKAGTAAALAILAITVQAVLREDANATAPRIYTLALMPPALRLVPAASEEAFFAGAAKLKLELEEDRAEAETR